jgi:hypothetical protein
LHQNQFDSPNIVVSEVKPALHVDFSDSGNWTARDCRVSRKPFLPDDVFGLAVLVTQFLPRTRNGSSRISGNTAMRRYWRYCDRMKARYKVQTYIEAEPEYLIAAVRCFTGFHGSNKSLES